MPFPDYRSQFSTGGDDITLNNASVAEFVVRAAAAAPAEVHLARQHRNGGDDITLNNASMAITISANYGGSGCPRFDHECGHGDADAAELLPGRADLGERGLRTFLIQIYSV